MTLKMGIIGKFFVFVALLWAAISRQVAWALVGTGLVALIFAVLYIQFLSPAESIGY